MTWRERKNIRRRERRAAGIRTSMEFPVPQPTTPFSANVVPVTFEQWQWAKAGLGHPAVLKLFRTFGSYRIKPKRCSAGVIYNNRAFWWSEKGYYRPGKDGGNRRPLQHVVWMDHNHRRKIPRLHEVFFRDRNRNNFAPENLELLSKADLHKRILKLGEGDRRSTAERRQIMIQRWAEMSPEQRANRLSKIHGRWKRLSAAERSQGAMQLHTRRSRKLVSSLLTSINQIANLRRKS